MWLNRKINQFTIPTFIFLLCCDFLLTTFNYHNFNIDGDIVKIAAPSLHYTQVLQDHLDGMPFPIMQVTVVLEGIWPIKQHNYFAVHLFL